MVKGYEFAKDQYVIFTPEELKALEEKGTQTIEITEFVPDLEASTRSTSTRPTTSAPDKGGAKPYALLAKAHAARPAAARSGGTRRAASSTSCMLRPVDGALVMQQLLYADEVRPIAEVEIPKTRRSRDAELEARAAAHRPAGRRHVRSGRVRRRREGADRGGGAEEGRGRRRSRSPQEAPAGGAQVIDLMEALRASLQKRAPEAAPAAEAKTRKEPKRAAQGSAAPAKRAARK